MKRRLQRTAPLVLLLVGLALLLVSCAAPLPRIITRIKIVQPSVPPQLLAVGPMPIVPQTNVSQATIAAYMTKLWVDDFNRRAQTLALRNILAQPNLKRSQTAQ